MRSFDPVFEAQVPIVTNDPPYLYNFRMRLDGGHNGPTNEFLNDLMLQRRNYPLGIID